MIETYNRLPQEDKREVKECVDSLIRALGTMVITPEYQMNEVTFKNEQIGSVQKPVLEGDLRNKTLLKLSQLIDKL